MTAAAALRTDAQERAFEEVIRRETPRLFGIAYTILRDRQEAADAVQDVVFAAWRREQRPGHRGSHGHRGARRARPHAR